MSESVTITRTVTTSESTSIFFNTGYLKSIPGILKILQIILGAVCLVLIIITRNQINDYYVHHGSVYVVHDIFQLLATTTFLIGSIILLLSCLISLTTGGLISKTIYVIYQLFPFKQTKMHPLIMASLFFFLFHFKGIPLSCNRCCGTVDCIRSFAVESE